MAQALTILDVAVREDKEGRFSLNDLHRAAVEAGVTKDIRPNEWMALDQTKEMVEFLITEKRGNSPIKASAGRYGGTFVCRELVYAYATWISAKFYLQVIRAYDALATGNLDEALRIARRQQDRQVARLEAPALTDAVKHSREVAGKEVSHYHFVNEFDLINRVALGMSAKQYRAAHGLSADDSIRDTLTALEIKCICHLQRYNASLIDFGLPFEKRKTELHKLYCLQYAGALACEVQRLEA